MAGEDEAQIADDFGQMVRMITGSAMQVRENQLRRRAVQQQQGHTAQAELQRREANVARAVQHDLYSREFWRTAGAESIADRLAVAAQLGDTHPAAQSAWMHGADTLRSQFGIDLQEINRAHPSSIPDRHAAMRDALDDYFAQTAQDGRDDAGASQQAAEVHAQAREEDRDHAVAVNSPQRWRAENLNDYSAQPREEGPDASQQAAEVQDRDDVDPVVTFPMYEMQYERDTTVQMSKQEALASLEAADGDRFSLDEVKNNPRSYEAHVKQWVGRDADVDRAIAEKFPDVMTDQERARALGQTDVYVDTAGVSARRDERSEMQDVQQDAARAEGQGDLAHVALARVRSAQLASFPNAPRVLNPASLGRAPARARRGAGQQPERQEVLSR